MRVTVITPPEPVLDLAAAKGHLRVEDDDSDAVIEAAIAAATAHIDGPDGWLGRAIGVQTLEARLDGFGSCRLALPYPPIISLTSVKYLDADGAEQTLDGAVYELRGRELGLAWQKSWPTTGCHPEAVRIRYQAGYETVPPAILAAIKLIVGDIFRFRETAVTGTIASEMPMSATVERLLAPLRIWS